MLGWGLALHFYYKLRLTLQANNHNKTWQQELNLAIETQKNEAQNTQQQLQNHLNQLQNNYLNQQHQHTLSQQSHLTKCMQDIRKQLQTTLQQHGDSLDRPLKRLTETIEHKLLAISQQVDKRLDDGFTKTNALFTDVVKRLAQIDMAQKRIQTLSESIVDLQTLLNDKRARGAFGEVQLATLIRNVVPEQHFNLQHTLSNGRRADCLLLLPNPTGNIAIDAKFPLESYQSLQNTQNADEIKQLNRQFKQDIRLHVQHIAQRYIIKNETAEGAIMFIPAEAIFAHIHAHHPDIVAHAQRVNVWLASPTTMMAILTTATTVLKDMETRNQVHEIQRHLGFLSEDFQRFRKRMDNLSRHIHQAHTDLQQVHTSSDKISKRFNAIEQVDLPQPTDATHSHETV